MKSTFDASVRSCALSRGTAWLIAAFTVGAGLGCSGSIGDELIGSSPGGAGGTTAGMRDPGTTGGGGGAMTVPGGAPTDKPVPIPAAGAIPPARVVCDARTGDAAPPRRIWRLTAPQYANTIAVAIGGRASATRKRPLPPAGLAAPFDVARAGGDQFTNQAPGFSINNSDFMQSMGAGRDAAAKIVSALKTDKSCLATGTPAFAECIRSLVESRGAILFRRPVTAEEATQYSGIATQTQPQLGPDEAAALAFQAMLMSPYFLFRTELGQGPADGTGALRLSPFEIAAGIAYSITDAPPDEELWTAATSGTLTTTEQIRGHALRLLAGLPEHEIVLRFLREYLHYPKAGDVAKDPKDFPFHDPDLLAEETDLWIKDLLASQGRAGLLKAILTSNTGFVRKATSMNYGVASTSATPVKVTFPDGQRAGILTQPSFLASYSLADENEPVARGRFIAERFLCQSIPLTTIPPFKDIGPNATLRERLSAHSADPACAACHRFMDPLGLGLEQFDHVGRYRTTASGKPVDATGSLYGTVNTDGTFKNGVEMALRLAGSPTVSECFSRHTFRYFVGREDAPGDACSIVEINNVYEKSGGDFVQMVAAIFSSRAFLHRK